MEGGKPLREKVFTFWGGLVVLRRSSLWVRESQDSAKGRGLQRVLVRGSFGESLSQDGHVSFLLANPSMLPGQAPEGRSALGRTGDWPCNDSLAHRDLSGTRCCPRWASLQAPPRRRGLFCRRWRSCGVRVSCGTTSTSCAGRPCYPLFRTRPRCSADE